MVADKENSNSKVIEYCDLTEREFKIDIMKKLQENSGIQFNGSIIKLISRVSKLTKT